MKFYYLQLTVISINVQFRSLLVQVTIEIKSWPWDWFWKLINSHIIWPILHGPYSVPHILWRILIGWTWSWTWPWRIGSQTGMDIWQLYMHINLVIALYNWSILLFFIWVRWSDLFKILYDPGRLVPVVPNLVGRIDVGDEYWGRLMLVTTLRCLWSILETITNINV